MTIESLNLWLTECEKKTPDRTEHLMQVVLTNSTKLMTTTTMMTHFIYLFICRRISQKNFWVGIGVFHRNVVERVRIVFHFLLIHFHQRPLEMFGIFSFVGLANPMDKNRTRKSFYITPNKWFINQLNRLTFCFVWKENDINELIVGLPKWTRTLKQITEIVIHQFHCNCYFDLEITGIHSYSADLTISEKENSERGIHTHVRAHTHTRRE